MWITKLKNVVAGTLAAAVVAAGVFAFHGPAVESAPPDNDPSRPAARSVPGGGPSPASAAMSRFKVMALEQVEKELLQVQSDLRRARVEFARAKSRVRVTDQRVAESAREERINQDATILNLRLRIMKLEDERRSVKVATTPPALPKALERIQVQMEETQKDLQGRQHELRPRVEEELRLRAREQWQAKLGQLSERVGFLADLEAVLSRDLERMSKELDARPSSTEERLRTVEKEVRQLMDSVQGLNKRK